MPADRRPSPWFLQHYAQYADLPQQQFCLDITVYLPKFLSWHYSYLPGPSKPSQLLNQRCDLKTVQDYGKKRAHV